MTARTTISLPVAMFDKAVARQNALGYPNFSSYILALIRADTLETGGHVRQVVEPPKSEPTTPERPRPNKKSTTKKKNIIEQINRRAPTSTSAQ